MYRAVTWWLLDQGVDLDDAELVAKLVPDIPLSLGTDPSAPTIRVGAVDASSAIRETRISETVSKVATNLDARAHLVARQQEIARQGGVVIEGRDITTVVAPDAPVRILLTAHEDVRLARRARDVHGADHDDAVAATRDQVLRRDADDSAVATFHEAADGVTVVDSSHMGLEDVVSAVLDVVEARTGLEV
jgi:cytidylate kinase